MYKQPRVARDSLWRPCEPGAVRRPCPSAGQKARNVSTACLIYTKTGHVKLHVVNKLLKISMRQLRARPADSRAAGRPGAIARGGSGAAHGLFWHAMSWAARFAGATRRAARARADCVARGGSPTTPAVQLTPVLYHWCQSLTQRWVVFAVQQALF